MNSIQKPLPQSLDAGIDVSRFQGAFAAVILPTLNEEKGLERTISEFPLDTFNGVGHRIVPVIIDGGSTDGTLEVARKWGIPVLKQTSRGKGGAMLEAIRWVYQQGIPFAVVLDADATYPPDRILPTLDLLRRGTDLVIGVRRPVWGPPSDVKDLVHRVGNLVMSYTSSALARRPILDLCSGFWGVSTERFMELGLGDTTFAIEAELVLKSIRRGFSVQQIPVKYRERLGIAKLHAVRDGGQILLTILQYARGAPSSSSPRPVRSAWSRDILSIGLALGAPGAVVECAPTDAAEAADLARFLLRNLPDTRVKVGDFHPVHPARAEMISPARDPRANADLEASPLVVSIPSGSSEVGDPRSMTVSIRNRHRQLTIELPSEAVEPRSGSHPNSAWARAGGRMGSNVPHRETFPSLMVVTSRLNFQLEHQQQALLVANGFRVVAQARTKPPSLKVASNEAVGASPSSSQ
ncbi:MAG: glycosyltransferase family 2 protein [Thermoplasmata archaeon]|nr:glycosyltransferase family 2 protein [Thermoplasmata archaeon]